MATFVITFIIQIYTLLSLGNFKKFKKLEVKINPKKNELHNYVSQLISKINLHKRNATAKVDLQNNRGPFFAFPAEIRKVIYTTNVIESVNRQIRKIIKNKGVFPDDKSIQKIIF